MKTIILCGGLGSRLSEETKITPKPMIKARYVKCRDFNKSLYAESPSDWLLLSEIEALLTYPFL